MADWGDNPLAAKDVLHGGPPMPYTDEEIDARIEEWHEARPGDPIAAKALHEHLGMTWDEYKAWWDEKLAPRRAYRAANPRGRGANPGRRLTEEAGSV